MTTSAAKQAALLMDRIQQGPIRTGWHWLGYNFTPGTDGLLTVGARTAMALATVEQVMPGFAEEQIRRLESLSGREMDQGHYHQIISWYAELLIAVQLAKYQWPDACEFEMEPTADNSKMNPELTVSLQGLGPLGIEVKAPDLRAHAALRQANPWQLNARTAVKPHTLAGGVTLPRDNPMKDFLVHADRKFAGFRAADPKFRSILVVVWDDFIQESVAPLLASTSGLFTPNSFHKEAGAAVVYPNVDGVLLVRHQHQFVRALAGRPLVDNRSHLLDFGNPNSFPPHALVTNPVGKELSPEFVKALHAVPIEELRGAAEYNAGEIVMWTDLSDGG